MLFEDAPQSVPIALLARLDAKPPFVFLGRGMTADVFLDARGWAYKIPRRPGYARAIAEEADWLRVASQVPFVRDHVVRFIRYDDKTGVLIREGIAGALYSPYRTQPGRLDRWALHQEIGRIMRPYGWGLPEYKDESYRKVKGRGWVLFDAGFALRMGTRLLAQVRRVSTTGFDGREMVWALRAESGRTIPPAVAENALREVARRNSQAREEMLSDADGRQVLGVGAVGGRRKPRYA